MRQAAASQAKATEALARVMDAILNGSVRFKTAAEVGKRAVFYCRGEDLFAWVMENKEMLEKKHAEALDGQSLDTPEDAIQFCDRLIRYRLMYRAQYKPIDGVIEQDEEGRYKRPKWPKRLAMSTRQNFDPQSFYVVVYEGSKSWQHFLLFCVIAAVLCVCMFPAWPLRLKVAVWYLSVILLTSLLLLVVVRLVIFVFFWFFGFHLWLLPNLFNEDAGIIESFQPWLEVERSEDDWPTFAARIFCALLTAGTLYKLSETHTPASVANFAKQSFLDVLDWGHQRLAAHGKCLSLCNYGTGTATAPTGYSKYASIADSGDLSGGSEGAAGGETAEGVGDEDDMKATRDGEHRLGDEEDYSCMKSCGFASFEHLMHSRCLVKCSCVQDLINSSCFPTCPQATQAALEEAKQDACEAERRRRKKKQ